MISLDNTMYIKNEERAPGNMNSFKAEKRRPHSCSGKYGTIIVWNFTTHFK
jgi:hypothetical protein